TLTAEQALQKLLQPHNDHKDDDAFWANFFTLPTTSEEIFSILSLQNVRSRREKQPQNLHTLLKKAVQRLRHHIEEANQGKHTAELEKSSLNCVRIISRIVPVLLETNGELADNIFWKQEQQNQGKE